MIHYTGQWSPVATGPSGPHCRLPGAACVLVKAGTTFSKISQQMQAASRDRADRSLGTGDNVRVDISRYLVCRYIYRYLVTGSQQDLISAHGFPLCCPRPGHDAQLSYDQLRVICQRRGQLGSSSAGPPVFCMWISQGK